MEKSENYRKAENYRPFIKKKVEAEAMSDNDIIKALNGADGLEHISIYCADNNGEDVTSIKIVDIIDLINRQQAEIERLKDERDKEHDYCNHYVRMCAKAKSEAIKEFAKKVETEFAKKVSENIRNRNPHWYIAKRIVRETAIEMTEVKENG